MSWVSRGEDRWEWTDADLHLLLKVGEEMREVHGRTVHFYRLGLAGLFPLEPLFGCEHVRSLDIPAIVNQSRTHDEAFDMLAALVEQE